MSACQRNQVRARQGSQGLQDWRQIEVNVHDPFFGGPGVFTGLHPG